MPIWSVETTRANNRETWPVEGNRRSPQGPPCRRLLASRTCRLPISGAMGVGGDGSTRIETGLQFQTPPSACVGIDGVCNSAHRSSLLKQTT